MSTKREPQANIFLSMTDSDLPDGFTNGFEKYLGMQQMADGGKATLYSSYDQNLGRRICIKKLSPALANDVNEKRRLLREARVTAQLQHPNTVPVYELGRDAGGNMYFAMKKIEGESLFRILSRIARGEVAANREYPLDSLLNILVHACNALAYAHTHGVIHRDVKPENIMVGMYGAVYLMDWGIAKVWGMPAEEPTKEDLPSSAYYDRLTRTGQRPGTPLYMSPEQVLCDRNIDERTDIFSVGVVLYELLALREPFRGRTVRDTFDNIVNENPIPPSQVAKDRQVPKRLEEICLKAMAKKPNDRYQSMLEMLEEIRNFRAEALQHVDD